MVSSLQIMIVHGTRGAPEGNWFPWMAGALSALGLEVAVPSFPTPEGQSFAAWREVFERHNVKPPAQTILVGHSIGAPFLLRVAEETQTPFKALFAVSPFACFLGDEDYDIPNKSFVEHPFDWAKVKTGARRRVCLMGDNDPYVPLAESQRIAAAIEAESHIVPGGGHLNAAFGYTSFPLLFELIEESLASSQP